MLAKSFNFLRLCFPTCKIQGLNQKDSKIYSTLRIYFLFLAALGLRCFTRAFSSCGEQGLLFIVVHRLLIAVSSLVAEHGVQACGLQQLQHAGSVVVAHGLSSCGSWAQLLCGIWDLPRPGIEPMSPAVTGRLLTIVPPGKSQEFLIRLVEFAIYTLHGT